MPNRFARTERVLAIVGAATLLIVGFDTATYATTGSSLILGSVNSANKTTTITNTANTAGAAGSPLSLKVTNAGAPPFTTNSKTKVTNLYADRAGDSDTLEGKTPAQVAAMSAKDAYYHEFPDTTLNGIGYVGTMTLPRGNWAVSLWADVEYQVDPAGSNYTLQSIWTKDLVSNGGLEPDEKLYTAIRGFKDPNTGNQSDQLWTLVPTQSTLTCGFIKGTGPTLTYGVPVTVSPSELDMTAAGSRTGHLNRPLTSVNNGGTPLSGPSTWTPVGITQAVTVGNSQSPISYTTAISVKCDTSQIPSDALLGGFLHIHGVRITAVPISGSFQNGS